MQRQASHIEHGREEVANAGKPSCFPRLLLGDKPMTRNGHAFGEGGFADEIPPPRLLVHPEPRGDLPIRSSLSQVEGMVVPEFTDQRVGPSLGADPQNSR